MSCWARGWLQGNGVAADDVTALLCLAAPHAVCAALEPDDPCWLFRRRGADQPVSLRGDGTTPVTPICVARRDSYLAGGSKTRKPIGAKNRAPNLAH